MQISYKSLIVEEQELFREYNVHEEIIAAYTSAHVCFNIHTDFSTMTTNTEEMWKSYETFLYMLNREAFEHVKKNFFSYRRWAIDYLFNKALKLDGASPILSNYIK